MEKIPENYFAQYVDQRAAKYRPYWAALGEFIHSFSQVERELQELTFHIAKVPAKEGRAILHGLRIDAAKDAIIRILDAREDEETKARLLDPFAQLGAIANMRNNILHWGAGDRPGETDFLVTNDFLAHTPAKLKEYRVSVLNLMEMSTDLTKIGMHLSCEVNLQHMHGEVYEKAIRPVLDAPWQYKPPQPSPQPSTPGTRARRRERKPQRGASRG
jgi:hypothetical protein